MRVNTTHGPGVVTGRSSDGTTTVMLDNGRILGIPHDQVTPIEDSPVSVKPVTDTTAESLARIAPQAKMSDGPRFPEGTPEYEAYRAELAVELAKFAKGEAPYEFDPNELGNDGGRAARAMGIGS